ncbi:MAG: hypothetical protein JEY94_12770 [Melioribacteraceae bacterium]|nr:hypothetical protein [Melioribacteraceae bacterium]
MNKIKIYIVLISLFFFYNLYDQVEIGVHCYLDPNESLNNPSPLQKSMIIANYNLTFVLCVEQGQPTNFSEQYIDEIGFIADYFDDVSYGDITIDNVEVLVDAVNLDGSVEAFELSNTLVAHPSFGVDYVVNDNMVREVLDSVDQRYDLSNFDYNDDGTVDMLVFMVARMEVGKWGTGTPGLPTSMIYTTNDTTSSGANILIDGSGYGSRGADHALIQRKRASSADHIISITVHELGHAWFNFPDVDHSGTNQYDHWSFGCFDEMTNGSGFRSRPSLYNPIFRIESDWLTPIEITDTETIVLEDIDSTSQIYYYDIPDRPGTSVGGQRIYLTCYSNTNRWQEYWPIPASGSNQLGLMVWRENRNLNILNTWNYSDYQYSPVDIESADQRQLLFPVNDNYFSRFNFVA